MPFLPTPATWGWGCLLKLPSSFSFIMCRIPPDPRGAGAPAGPAGPRQHRWVVALKKGQCCCRRCRRCCRRRRRRRHLPTLLLTPVTHAAAGKPRNVRCVRPAAAASRRCFPRADRCPSFSPPAGKVAKAQVAASQIDWRVMQQSQTERWLKCVRSAFQGESRSGTPRVCGRLSLVLSSSLRQQSGGRVSSTKEGRVAPPACAGSAMDGSAPPLLPRADLDTDGDGIISSGEMVAMLRNKLPQAEVRNLLCCLARQTLVPCHPPFIGAAAAALCRRCAPGSCLPSPPHIRSLTVPPPLAPACRWRQPCGTRCRRLPAAPKARCTAVTATRQGTACTAMAVLATACATACLSAR